MCQNRICLVLLTAVFFFGCTPKQPTPIPTNAIEVGDLEELPELSEEEKAEDRELVANYKLRKDQISKMVTKDTVEKKVMMAKKKKLEEVKAVMEQEVEKILETRAKKKAIKIFEEQVVSMIKKDSKLKIEEVKQLLEKAAKGELSQEELKQVLVEKLGVSVEEVEKLVREGGKEALLARVLQETTTLAEEEIKEVVQAVEKIDVETAVLRKQISKATTGEEVRKILEKTEDISTEEIAVIVEKKELAIQQEKSFLHETMAKLYARLQRDRRLNVEEAFCSNIEGILDHLLIEPTFFQTDKYNISEYVDKINRNYQLLVPILADYPDIMLQLEGNADNRGSNDYNKALAERRWRTPSRVLVTLYSVRSKIPVTGVSRGEECQLGRQSGESMEKWWTRNRRTDYMFKFKGR